MKLEEFWTRYGDYTVATSNNLRQLAFAGFALVWIYNDEKTATLHMPRALLYATLCFIAAIILDYVQYFYNALLCYFVARWRQHKHIVDDKIFNDIFWCPSEACFVFKSLALFCGYFLLSRHIYNISNLEDFYRGYFLFKQA